MVFHNDIKYACESCIKGHRSSSCHHTERPLFEVKKKGRPVTQCEKCRELRSSRKFHSKCVCKNTKEIGTSQAGPSSSTSEVRPKTRRFIPIVPALPNGIKDILQNSQASPMKPADSRQRVDTLLNPSCSCKNAWTCRCGPIKSLTAGKEEERSGGLSALAQAAELFNAPTRPRDVTSKARRLSTTSSQTISTNSTPSCCSDVGMPSTSRSSTPPPKRPKLDFHEAPESDPSDRGPLFDLPPIGTGKATEAQMPGISTIASIAGTSCTCGFECGCPGCVEHRGKDHVSPGHRDCAQGCGVCVDRSHGLALPLPSSFSASASSSSTPSPPAHAEAPHGAHSHMGSPFDQFLLQAARIPAPPPMPGTRKGNGGALDPMNVALRPRRPSVTLPKLECCGGRCGCPNGDCACTKACDGCCADHDVLRNPGLAASAMQISEERMQPVASRPQAKFPAIKSCCAGKVQV